MKKSFYLINLSRGKIVDTKAVVNALNNNKLLGACLDVLEFEKNSFENLFSDAQKLSSEFSQLLASDKVILSPHVGGWTVESYYKLSSVLLSKIKKHYLIP
jgi:D-3-phosphoglycerate dehydrogenase